MSVRHERARGEISTPPTRGHVGREPLRAVKERDPDAIIQISTGGRAPNIPGMPAGTVLPNWRIDPLNLLPEMGSYTPGSVNLNPIVYANDAKLVQDLAEKYKATGIKPQIEVFDSNMISMPLR